MKLLKRKYQERSNKQKKKNKQNYECFEDEDNFVVDDGVCRRFKINS